MRFAEIMKGAEIAKRYEKKYGHQGVSVARQEKGFGVVSTGTLALDYALGIGGWPYRHISQVYGPADIGKSSCIGLSAIKSVQESGKVAALVAVEPGFDPFWAERHGVDVDELVVAWPDDGQAAFEALNDFVLDPDIHFIIFDSIGQVQRPSELDPKTGKPNQGGASALISWGIQRILMPCWKYNKGVLLLNQIRDDFNNRQGIPNLFRPPGGHAIEHASSIIVQLKPGKDRHMTKVDGNDVMAGRTIAAHVRRNKLAEGTGQVAKFDFYQMETDEYPFGIDAVSDILSTAMRTGVIKRAGAWYQHDTFPGTKHQLQGSEAVAEFFAKDTNSNHQIRAEVLDVMKRRQKEAIEKKTSNGSKGK